MIEDEVRERVREARLARGWSYETLASEMTEAGFPMNGSTAWKIVIGKRRITINELFALSEIFDFNLYDFKKRSSDESEFERGLAFGKALGRKEAAEEIVSFIQTNI